ncbi:hypothetical protein CLOM_g6733, partial [Closterium sp. NIES-68]
ARSHGGSPTTTNQPALLPLPTGGQSQGADGETEAARLALEPVLADGDVQLWSYADDTYVLGTPERVLQSFTAIQRRLGELGLSGAPGADGPSAAVAA